MAFHICFQPIFNQEISIRANILKEPETKISMVSPSQSKAADFLEYEETSLDCNDYYINYSIE